ncbi:hypothetical protein HPB50_010990 [Hyalomma asiaticum]|uniref:Uncharacterized protein n=1 Tax=Hyalomma asiaticum TaxID=266040 RepID=A0ACB7T9Q5_HYAAI|nr:hypothetical protein HPB50_010990 [Hyalomma asiaticum]
MQSTEELVLCFCPGGGGIQKASKESSRTLRAPLVCSLRTGVCPVRIGKFCRVCGRLCSERLDASAKLHVSSALRARGESSEDVGGAE